MSLVHFQHDQGSCNNKHEMYPKEKVAIATDAHGITTATAIVIDGIKISCIVMMPDQIFVDWFSLMITFIG
jgi:hypothetical protein